MQSVHYPRIISADVCLSGRMSELRDVQSLLALSCATQFGGTFQSHRYPFFGNATLTMDEVWILKAFPPFELRFILKLIWRSRYVSTAIEFGRAHFDTNSPSEKNHDRPPKGDNLEEFSRGVPWNKGYGWPCSNCIKAVIFPLNKNDGTQHDAIQMAYKKPTGQ